MASRKGTLLERNVEQILKLVGLKPELNKIYHGYEIDVFLKELPFQFKIVPPFININFSEGDYMCEARNSPVFLT